MSDLASKETFVNHNMISASIRSDGREVAFELRDEACTNIDSVTVLLRSGGSLEVENALGVRVVMHGKSGSEGYTLCEAFGWLHRVYKRWWKGWAGKRRDDVA